MSPPAARPAIGAGPRSSAATLRRRILTVVAFIDILCCLAAIAVIVLNARTATQVEMAASLEIAESFVREQVTRIERDVGRLRSVVDLDVELAGIRHVRISVLGRDGGVVTSKAAETAADGEQAPAWFTALIAGATPRREIAVTIAGERAGTVVVHGEPSDEIAEVWSDLTNLGALFVILNVLALSAFAVALRRLLAPLGDLASGLSELERRGPERRLTIPAAPELAALAQRFNALAAGLSAERATNARLSLRMVTLQDEERRQIANDLHDELGPCLFGLRANLCVLEGDIASVADRLRPGAQERFASVIEISERLQTVNSRLLRSLRPIALGEAPLAEVVGGLIADFVRHHPDRMFDLAAEEIAEGYGPVVDLTVYRCVQEGVTNALRHANCSRVTVALAERRGPEGGGELAIQVRDDGEGVPETVPVGFGLQGLGERLEALGGGFALRTVANGAALDVVIPLRPGAARSGASS
jgi:two-component system sensor histidine kinase UhpB